MGLSIRGRHPIRVPAMGDLLYAFIGRKFLEIWNLATSHHSHHPAAHLIALSSRNGRGTIRMGYPLQKRQKISALLRILQTRKGHRIAWNKMRIADIFRDHGPAWRAAN